MSTKKQHRKIKAEKKHRSSRRTAASKNVISSIVGLLVLVGVIWVVFDLLA